MFEQKPNLASCHGFLYCWRGWRWHTSFQKPWTPICSFSSADSIFIVLAQILKGFWSSLIIVVFKQSSNSLQAVFKLPSSCLQVVFLYLESYSRSLKYFVLFILPATAPPTYSPPAQSTEVRMARHKMTSVLSYKCSQVKFSENASVSEYVNM